MEDCICGYEALMDLPTFSPSQSVDRSLYVHIPFCRHRCGYCNFTLVAGRDDLVDRFLDALAIEFSWLTARQTVQTIFLGGGTPSHLEPQQLERLFEIIYSKFDVVDSAEVSAECNPNDMNQDLAETFGRVGVNRISFGVQSFNSDKLIFLERDHNDADIVNAVHLASQFTDNISLDLIFATQDERVEDWISDLEKASKLQPKHLSTYELTIEKGTQFWNRYSHGLLSTPEDELKLSQYLRGIEFLQSRGYEHYEISSFAQRGFQCQHNRSYWTGKDYFAFGPGAARFIDGVRETNHRSTTTYIKKIERGQSPVCERQTLNKKEIATDLLLFGLRQIQGISITDFSRAADGDAQELLKTVSELIDDELLTIENGCYKLTQNGIIFYDTIAQKIFTES